MSLESFNMNDLLLLIVGVSGATATLCLAIQKSKCKNISILYGCFKCDRDTDLILKQEALELGKKLSNYTKKGFKDIKFEFYVSLSVKRGIIIDLYVYLGLFIVIYCHYLSFFFKCLILSYNS